MTTEERNSDLAANLVSGLRDLANFIAANPDLAEGFRYELTSAGINVHLQHAADDKATEQGRYAQAAARHGATVDKVIDDQWHNLTLTFAGGVKVDVLAYRSEVCERVVTGVETVTKTVPDPDALAAVSTVEVTEQVETIEWVCRPVLAGKAVS
jgi:putative NIF3 family GTP cyclohydrolase 1 type 2